MTEPGSRIHRDPLATRVRTGMLTGFFFAVLFSLLVVIPRLSLGATGFKSDLGVSYIEAVLVYFVTMPLGGAVAGACSNWFSGGLRAFTLGCLATLPTFMGAALTANFPGTPRRLLILIGLFGSVFIGGGGFSYGWYKDQGRRAARRALSNERLG
jgi:hypothetical protein